MGLPILCARSLRVICRGLHARVSPGLRLCRKPGSLRSDAISPGWAGSGRCAWRGCAFSVQSRPRGGLWGGLMAASGCKPGYPFGWLPYRLSLVARLWCAAGAFLPSPLSPAKKPSILRRCCRRRAEGPPGGFPRLRGGRGFRPGPGQYLPEWAAEGRWPGERLDAALQRSDAAFVLVYSVRRCCAVLLAALAVPLFRCHVLAQFPPRCVVRVDCNRKGAAFRHLVQAEGAQAEGRSCGGSP